MPRLSGWALRSSLVYLLIGFTFGALMLANKGQPFAPWIWSLLPAHVEFLLVGWMVQLAAGVAFWILPRFPGGSRGNESLVAASILLLNLGVLLVALQGWVPWLFPLGRCCETLSGLLFALHAWGRIRPFSRS
jgi:hypothetical protein